MMPTFTTTTKRMIVGGLISMALISIMATAVGDVKFDDAILVVMPIITGLLALLKGVD